MIKAPIPTENPKKQRAITQTPPKTSINYTTNADRLTFKRDIALSFHALKFKRESTQLASANYYTIFALISWEPKATRN